MCVYFFKEYYESQFSQSTIIEDHRITAEAYRNIVENIPEIDFKVSITNNFDVAVEQINHNTWDLILLD